MLVKLKSSSHTPSRLVNNMEKTNRTRRLLLAGACISTLAAGGWFAVEKSAIAIAGADIKLVSATSLPSTTNRLIGEERIVRANEADAVSEKIAQSLIAQLGHGGVEAQKLADSLRTCSASHASKMQGDKSSCFDTDGEDAAPGCLVKRGVGQKSVGQILTADRFDLNGDGIPDYIMSDRYYCLDLSANQAGVYFVMLSGPKGDFDLAYADWATSALEVVVDPVKGGKVLIERSPKTYGIYSRVLQLVNKKFVPRICIVNDENGFSRCDPK